ncbi:MAG TPA: hypothetical protein VF285_06900 [Castellaniella sp.]|uniref:hypothetical protein n=1 Tax=Castellaniella sp. TaxID=1955812 RepID=UPI002EDFFBAE
MKTFLLRRLGQIIVSLAAVSALAGCAVYAPAPPAYYDSDGVVYAAPAPVYVGPPVYLNFGWWGGRGYGRGWHHGRRW